MFESLSSIMNNGALILSVLIYLYYFAVIVYLIMSNREPAVTLAWLAVLFFLPYIGLVLYILLGRDWKRIEAGKPIYKSLKKIEKRAMAKIYADSGQKAAKIIKGDDLYRRLSTNIQNQDDSVALLGKVEILVNGEKKFPKLLADLEQAQKFIHMEYFIWEYDELTHKVTDILLKKLKEGVEVRVAYDWLGCLLYNKKEIRALKRAGADLYADVKSIRKINYRNHRKIVVIDKKICYVGGLNMGQEYIDGGEKYPFWRDTHLRIEGDFAAECQRFFADKWYVGRKGNLFSAKYIPAQSTMSVSDPAVSAIQMGDSDVADYWESIRRNLSYAINNAQNRVWIQSPYFVPDMSYYDSMIDAAQAGVDVRFMMTGWPDKKIAFNAARSYYEKALRAGVRIYTYQKGFFHAKTMTVDGKLAAIGTTNVDIRSQKLHNELTAFIFDTKVAKKHEKIFLADMKECHEVTLAEVLKYTRWEKFRNSASRLFSNLL